MYFYESIKKGKDVCFSDVSLFSYYSYCYLTVHLRIYDRRLLNRSLKYSVEKYKLILVV